VNPRAWGLLWATLTGALVAVPETEPGWLWEAGHVVSSVLLAWLVVALADQLVLRALCALSRGSGAWGQVTVTSEPADPDPGQVAAIPELRDQRRAAGDLERLEDRSVVLLARVGTMAAEIALIRARYAHLNRRPEA
jgi:hypothetical protein